MDQGEGQDQLLTCADCGAQFTFTAKDQAFYRQRGFVAPRRCRECRDKRKAAGPGQPEAAGYGPRHAPAPRGPSYGAPEAEGAGRQFFKVVCAACGTETTVPFKPDPNRPAYCRKCYLVRRRSAQGQPPEPGQAPSPAEAPPAPPAPSAPPTLPA